MENVIRTTRKVACLLVALGFTSGLCAEEWMNLTPMNAEQLDDASGRQGIPTQWLLNDAEQNALVSGNVLDGSVITGDNSISDRAFENMSGIATVIQNTGNQVVIQDSTQINILINH